MVKNLQATQGMQALRHLLHNPHISAILGRTLASFVEKTKMGFVSLRCPCIELVDVVLCYSALPIGGNHEYFTEKQNGCRSLYVMSLIARTWIQDQVYRCLR